MQTMAEIYYHFTGYDDTSSCNKIMACRVGGGGEKVEEKSKRKPQAAS